MSQNIYKYDGKKADVYWDKRLCMHVGECGRATCELFELGREPWCQPDVVDMEDVTDVVERCPTGAIYYERKDGGAEETAPTENTLFISNNGALYFTGDLEIEGATEDMKGTQFRAALCRCGKSSQKPFCDGDHETNGFIDRGAVGDAGEPLAETGGKLQIKKAPDGPLLVYGNLTIRTGNGRVAWQGTKAALCRCGHSKNKPFCDGGHVEAGFKAE